MTWDRIFRIRRPYGNDQTKELLFKLNGMVSMRRDLLVQQNEQKYIIVNTDRLRERYE